MSDFTGKSIIVTGGTKGIGNAIARSFFDAGACVLVCSRNGEEAAAAAHSVDPTGKRFVGIQADVSVVADCEKVINSAVERFGTVDILVNNAGIYGEIGSLETCDINKWACAINVNLLGTVACSKFVLPIMKKAGKGKIINFAGAGVGGKKPLPNFSPYFTSKAAVVGFTETIASEIVASNIQINAVAPGAINTGMTEALLAGGPDRAGTDSYKKALEQKEKGGESLDKVIALIHFLCTSDADNVTGRLLSAKWDNHEMLKGLPADGDLLKLRRIDNDLFYGK